MKNSLVLAAEANGEILQPQFPNSAAVKGQALFIPQSTADQYFCKIQ